jgi:hypothetical protein
MVRTPRDDRLESDRRHLYVNTGQASEMLGGLLTANTLRTMALRGEIRGALRVHKRVLIPIKVVPSLIKELEHQTVPAAERPLVLHDRRGHVTLDGYLDAG